ncbi:2552_t:CDS:2 [Ambispora gerdemannii]|uniref:2552_t:CDS:1 n=1 Tax=Ambispora gerdemannii TaxID=144530 RepID=A0A9N8W880_9GLOM|nr:2552_t:CDS:2 [Ambispora gerdemannii]
MKKYCGLLMFDNGSKEVDSYDNSQNNNDSLDSPFINESLAAGAAAGDEDGRKSANSDSNASDPTITAKQPPRPPNAFILYRQAKQPALIQADKHLTNAQVSRQMADMWKAEPPHEKLKWERMADRRKLEHMKQYPNYIYKPNKKNKVDKTRKNARQEKAKKSVAAVASNKSNVQQNSRNMESSRTGPIRTNSIKTHLKPYQSIGGPSVFINHPPAAQFPIEFHGNYHDSAALLYTQQQQQQYNPIPITPPNSIPSMLRTEKIPNYYQPPTNTTPIDLYEGRSNIEYYLHNGPSTPSTSNSSVTNSPITNHPVASNHYFQPEHDISYVALLQNDYQFYNGSENHPSHTATAGHYLQ